MSFDPKACPLCGSKLNIEFDIDPEGHNDVVVYECSDCDWTRTR